MKRVWERRSHAFPPHYTPVADLFHKLNGAQPASVRPHAAFDNEICGRPHAIYKIWRPCWRILKQNKRKARKSVDTMRNNLDDDVSFNKFVKCLTFYYTGCP